MECLNKHKTIHTYTPNSPIIEEINYTIHIDMINAISSATTLNDARLGTSTTKS